MARKQVIVQLDEVLVEDLDYLAKALKINRSELLRRAGRHYLEAMKNAVDEQRTVDSYIRFPERPDDWAGGFDNDRILQ